MRLSIIIPTYNCIPILRQNILALINQNINDSYEVLICDDGSTDKVEEAINNLKIQYSLPFELKYFYQEKNGFGAGRARNLGIANASGEKLLFLDQDIFVTPHHVDMLANNTHKNICRSGVKKLVPLRFYKEYNIDENTIINNFDIFHKEHFGEIQATLSSFGCIMRSDLEKVKGFDEDFNEWGLEDTELIERLKDVGINGYSLRCISYHIGHENHGAHTLTKKNQELYHYKRNNRKGDGSFVSI